MIDAPTVSALAQAASLAFAIGACIYARHAKRSQAGKQEIDNLWKVVRENGGELQKVAGLVDGLPREDAITRLHACVEEVRGNVKELGAAIEGIDKQLGPINTHLDMLIADRLEKN